jgi:hypothetical protein
MFDTKVALVIREDLQVWQKLNVTAFLTTGVATSIPGLIGEAYRDANDLEYHALLIQPVLIFSASKDELKRAYHRALEREIKLGVYIEEMFSTGDDTANRAAVRAVASQDLNLVGIAMRAARGTVDKAVKGLKLHT